MNYDKSYWDTYYNSLDSYNNLPCMNEIANFLALLYEQYGTKRDRYTFLDLGGASGIIAYLLDKKMNSHTHNFDISLEAIRTGHGILIDISKDQWPLPDNSIDFIFSIQVLEHISDIDNIFYEIKSKLKSDGLLFLSIAPPNNIRDITHINLKPKEYWLSKLKEHNLVAHSYQSQFTQQLDWMCFIYGGEYNGKTKENNRSY